MFDVLVQCYLILKDLWMMVWVGQFITIVFLQLCVELDCLLFCHQLLSSVIVLVISTISPLVTVFRLTLTIDPIPEDESTDILT